ncbi:MULTISPECIES: MarR family winged helix-turn-helix transcriptional regulator [Microbacterium]|uniref:MarR family transcriptional regulator n=1 Tax=Microbacterium sufflavum TaxID=2851649 RepID=A0ABY4IGL9_9MICO|nr:MULTISPECIES: MarR family transcriptional regulator [Microbacterium]MBN6189978.1 MarR family transcriptional regulator [Aneurinibacillus sp. BA2021]MPS75875.1 MarR family transcriptional regulator [Microbacterium sp.]UPL11914.1 MarR family transcriptional regulator [Microbacterium sufflavum]
MNRVDVIPSLVLSGYALGRIAAQDAGNDAPAAQWRVLSLLTQTGPRRVGELAAAARTTQPGMTRLIGTLEREGLVHRSPDPDDSRAITVAITEAGTAAVDEWRAEFRSTIAPRFADLDDDDWAALTRAARILAERTTADRAGDHQ